MRHQHWPKSAWAAILLTPAVCFAQAGTNPFAGNAQAAADGQKLFSVSCAPCHGRNGEGAQGQAEGMRPPDLTRGDFKAGRRDEDLFRVISDGVRGTEMPSFKSLGSDQIWRLITFVRTLSACRARAERKSGLRRSVVLGQRQLRTLPSDWIARE